MNIHIKDLRFDTIVGLLAHERLHAQAVCLHVKIAYDFDGTHFIDYAKVCELIQEDMQTQKYVLLEEALEGIYRKILSAYPKVSKIFIKISKPTIIENALVGVSCTFRPPQN